MNYEYVLVVADSNRIPLNVLSAAHLDALTSLITICALDTDNVTYRAFTRSQADKLGIKPQVVCLGEDVKEEKTKPHKTPKKRKL